MPSIIAPIPSPLSSSIYRNNELQRIPRLLSPIQLTPAVLLPSPSIQKSTCNPSTKRRAKRTSLSPRRRRPLSRVDCQVEPTSHPFDQLPWIAALEATPDSFSPWNIADLSQIPDAFPSSIPPSGPGPVRRRKTSLRSNPIALPPVPTSSTQFSDDLSWAAGSTLPFCDTPISSSQTPRSRFIPSRVLFRNLMPVYNDQPDDCTFTRALPY